MPFAIAKPVPRILLPFLPLLLFASAAVARVNGVPPISGEESSQVLQQIERGETPEAFDLVRALYSDSTTLRARAAERLGHVQIGSIDECYALGPLIDFLSDDSTHDGATYPDPGMATTRWWAHASLQRISGKDFGYRWDAPLVDRLPAIGQWWEWGWQRRLALLRMHPDFELRPTMSRELYSQSLLSKSGNDTSWLAEFWKRTWSSSVMERGALGAMCFAAIVLVGAPWLAPDRRRLLRLIVFTAILGLGGYAYFDRQYLIALFRMRDVPAVREECRRMLMMSRASGGSLGLHSGHVAFPQSFHALGIAFMAADDFTVELMWKDGSESGPYYSYLYDPEGLWVSIPDRFKSARPTLWKGIYLFHPTRG